MGCSMQAEGSVTITACKGFISTLIPIRAQRVKGFISPSSAHYPFRRHVLFIATFRARATFTSYPHGEAFLHQEDRGIRGLERRSGFLCPQNNLPNFYLLSIHV